MDLRYHAGMFFEIGMLTMPATVLMWSRQAYSWDTAPVSLMAILAIRTNRTYWKLQFGQKSTKVCLTREMLFAYHYRSCGVIVRVRRYGACSPSSTS